MEPCGNEAAGKIVLERLEENAGNMNAERALTEVQLQAVDAPPGRLIFLGAPGSGKSTVIVERVIRLIQSGAVRPEAVLILASSRRAAVALGRFVHDRLGASQGPTAISFHGLALGILRRHYREMGYSRLPALLTTSHHFHALRTMLAEEDPSLWPHYRGRLGTSTLRKLAYDVVMGAAENGLDAVELWRRARRWGQTDLEDLASFVARYRARLWNDGLVDFGELLVRVIDLLATNRDVARTHRRAYRHVLVDEFEQANFAQAELLCHLLDDEIDLLVAGNPEQAINRYRGGTPSHLLALPERLSARVVVSCENHRCRRRIAGLGSALRPPGSPPSGIKVSKAVGPESGQVGGEDGRDDAGYVVVRQFTYLSQETSWVGAEVESLLRAGVPPSRIAILFRSLATPLVGLVADELDRRRIPHRAPSGQAVLDDALVRGAIATLRYLSASSHLAPPLDGQVSPGAQALEKDGDLGDSGLEPDVANAFLHVLDSPLAGLPSFGLEELRRATALAGREPGRLEADGLEGLALREDLRDRLMALLDRLRALRPKVHASASTLLWDVWRLFPAFRDDALAGGKSSTLYGAVLNEVASLEDERGFVGVRDFVERVENGYFEHVGAYADGKRGLLITTVHQSKGQEWDVVFLPGLVEGAFPLRCSSLDVGTLLASDLDPAVEQEPARAAARLHALRQARHAAEERRIFYVATSRPRRGLYLSCSRRAADGTAVELPSRFLGEVAECPGVEVVPGDKKERLPMDVDGAAVHYRGLLRSADPLLRASALYGLQKMRQRWPEVVRPEEWWSNVAETFGAAPPFPDRRLYLSASRLGAYRDCPLAYQFGYHWRLGEPEGPALTIGSILHAVLEDYHRPESPLSRTREALEESLERHFNESAFRYRPIAKQARRALGEMLDKFFVRYGHSSSVVAVEASFSFAFGPHRIGGYIDRIDRLPEGGLELIDYKTGQPMTKAEAENDLQLALYDLAFCNDDGLRDLGRPMRASYLYLKSIGPRADGKRSYAPSDESRERLRARVIYYADAIVAERFPPHRALADELPDLDPAELDRALHKDPCRFCAFDWVCPQMEGSDE